MRNGLIDNVAVAADVDHGPVIRSRIVGRIGDRANRRFLSFQIGFPLTNVPMPRSFCDTRDQATQYAVANDEIEGCVFMKPTESVYGCGDERE